jgi:hypothetical protein
MSSCYASEGQVRPARRSQRQRILDLLIAARGREVPAPELAKLSLQYSSRVLELRRLGHCIVNRVEIANGVKRGFFRLVIKPPAGRIASAAVVDSRKAKTAVAAPVQEALFPEVVR